MPRRPVLAPFNEILTGSNPPEPADALVVDACANELDERYASVVRLWTLRALLRANVASALVGEHRFQGERVARLLGWGDAAPAGYCAGRALVELREKLSTVPADPILTPRSKFGRRGQAR